jgi:hypothetical protein
MTPHPIAHAIAVTMTFTLAGVLVGAWANDTDDATPRVLIAAAFVVLIGAVAIGLFA